MTVVDASALVAILLDEPEAERFARYLLARPGCAVSPVGYWEAATRLRGIRGDGGVAELDTLMRQLDLAVVPATANTASLAAKAERAFGKRTPARLNMGDCFAYALARELDAPLLYKGADFNRTDVQAARIP